MVIDGLCKERWEKPTWAAQMAYERNSKAKARSAETGELFVPTDPQLKARHFKKIAWIHTFDTYISETKGAADAKIALRESQRMNEYRPSRRLVRDIEQQPIHIREDPVLKIIPIRGPRPKEQVRAAPAGQTFARGNRQVHVRAPVAFTHNTPERRELQYDQPFAGKGTKSINTSGARTAAAMPRRERLSTAHSRPKAVQRSSSFEVHNREGQRHEVLDQHQAQYEDEPEYESSYEGSFSRPVSAYVHFEDTNQRDISPRRRQVGKVPAISRKSAVVYWAKTSRTTKTLSIVEKAPVFANVGSEYGF